MGDDAPVRHHPHFSGRAYQVVRAGRSGSIGDSLSIFTVPKIPDPEPLFAKP